MQYQPHDASACQSILQDLHPQVHLLDIYLSFVPTQSHSLAMMLVDP